MGLPCTGAARRATCGLLLALLVPLACGVARPTPALDTGDYSTLPNLRRAQEALQDRIAREQEHVEALKLQIVALRADEELLYQSFLVAETDYQLREKDLAGVEADLATAQQALEAGRAQLAAAQAELATVEAELLSLLAAVTARRSTLTEAQQEFDALLADLQARLEASLPPPAQPGPQAPAPPVGEPLSPEPLPLEPLPPEQGAPAGDSAPSAGGGGA